MGTRARRRRRSFTCALSVAGRRELDAMGSDAELMRASSPLFFLRAGLDALNKGGVRAGRTGPFVQAAPASREGRYRSRNATCRLLDRFNEFKAWTKSF